MEYNDMFTGLINFNRPAERWAARHGKPLVGNCDVHRLRQLGSTYSLVDAEPHPDAICAAIVAGRVRVERQPLSIAEAARVMAALLASNITSRRFNPMKLIIVERHQISAFERLLEKFSDHLDVTVVWDRRIGERRQRPPTRREERRKGDRRALRKPWTGQDYIVVHTW